MSNLKSSCVGVSRSVPAELHTPNVSGEDRKEMLQVPSSKEDVLPSSGVKRERVTKVVPKLDNANWDSRAYDSLSKEKDEY